MCDYGYVVCVGLPGRLHQSQFSGEQFVSWQESFR